MVPDPVPLAHQHRAGPGIAGRGRHCRAFGDPIQQPDAITAEVAEGLGLDPIGQHPEQQVPGQVLGRRLAGHGPEAGPQTREIEVAQPRDLVLHLREGPHRQSAA